MRRTTAISATTFVFLLAAGTFPKQCLGQRKIHIQAAAKQVGKYEKLEMLITLENQYKNPFDPDEVDLTVLLKCPNGEQITLPAFYCQNYERRQLNQGRNRANWYYPTGEGVWKARFAPMATGSYLARARLKDRRGTVESDGIRFECIGSSPLRGERKGYLRTGQKDPRFLEFTEGGPFFAIGQNLAFVGEGQYVNLTKAEEIFGKLSRNLLRTVLPPLSF